MQSSSPRPLYALTSAQVWRWLAVLTIILLFQSRTHAQSSSFDELAAFELSGTTTSGPLEITRIDLAFDNGWPQRTVAPGERIGASALIRFRGNGLFRAVWRLDGQIVEQANLVVDRGSRLRLPLSPNMTLPTLIPGEHVLKLEVQSPATLLVPVIRYFVVPAPEPEATLYIRPIGAENWQRRPLAIDAVGQVNLKIPSDMLVSPGIDYYVEIVSTNGAISTDPAKEPRVHPYRVEVAARTDEIELSLQGETTERPGDAPIIINLDSVDPGGAALQDLRVMLDGIDVTGLIEIDGDRLVIDPPATLPAGAHTLVITSDRLSKELTLASFPFTVAATEAPPNSLYARGNVSFQYGANGAADGPATRATGNAALAFGGNVGDTEYQWNGININYDKDADSPWDLSAGFTFSVTHDNKHFQYGDISISESPLTVSGFARRGLRAQLDNAESRLRFFVVGSEPVEGFDSGLSTSSNNQVIGASYAMQALAGSPLNVKLISVLGENSVSFANSVASTASPSKGETIGVQLDATLGDSWIGLDSGFSRFDDNTLDGQEAASDTAFSLQARHNFDDLQLSASLLRYGSDYATIANPNFTGDRKGGTLGLTATLGPAALGVQLSRSEDNINGDTTRPVVSSDAVSTSLSLAWPDAPRLNFALSQSRQHSSDEPSAQDQVDNSNTSFSAGISHGGDGWQAALNTSVGELDDRLAGNADSSTRGVSLSAGINNRIGNLSASISQSLIDSANVENESVTLGLNGSASLIENELTLNANLNFQRASASDNSVDNEGSSAALVLRYSGGDLFRRLRKSFGGNAELSLSVEHRDQENPVDATQSNDSVVFLNFTLGAPLDFRTDW